MLNASIIEIRINTALVDDIAFHLNSCKYNFSPPLDEIVNIQEYSKKIVAQSVTFEAWISNTLISCVAAYFNDEDGYSGYITNVSTLNHYFGYGIASKLMDKCVDYAKKNNYLEIKLQVSTNNTSAIRLYRKFGFSDFEYVNDSITMKLEIQNERKKGL